MLLPKNACVHSGCIDIDIDYYLDKIDCSLATQEPHEVGDKGKVGDKMGRPYLKWTAKAPGR